MNLLKNLNQRRLQAGVAKARKVVGGVLLAPAVMLANSPVWAALPTMPAPGTDMNGQAVAAGDWMGTMSAWIKAGVVLFGLAVVGYAFIHVVMGAITKWRAYSTGKGELGDVKEYIVFSALLAVFIVVMVTYAFQTVGN